MIDELMEAIHEINRLLVENGGEKIVSIRVTPRTDDAIKQSIRVAGVGASVLYDPDHGYYCELLGTPISRETRKYEK